MTDENPITLEAAVQQVIGELDGPTAVAEVVRRVLALWPSAAKRPEQTVRNQLSQHWNRTWVYPDAQTVTPLRVVMQGVRLRIVLSRLEIKHGALFFEPNFRGFARLQADPASFTLLDAAGQPLPARPVKIKIEHKSPFGDYTFEAAAWDVAPWLKGLKARDGDSLLVTIEDWETGRYRLEHEPAAKRRLDEVDRANRELADLLFGALERAHSESISGVEAIPKAYARMADPRGYPGDPWMKVVAQDSRMKLFGDDIRYPESYAPIERILDGARPRPKALSVSAGQRQQVYRFKAAFKHRPGLWRCIEIQGGQTLKDLDGVMRGAFGHDFSDHMSGFWRKLRRGDSKRFREVEIGTIAPFGGEGEGANTRIASIGLAVGDELKYVYDFGDWIEHTITLEAIGEPEQGVEYPRVVAQNKPNYQDCERCKAQGRQTRAIWVCHHCSSEQGRAVLLCQDCLFAEHEEHYADEIVY
ncbi:MAG: hypothetical protein FJ011_13580 [Chloroflexi bacterium]|nr:hypothetical protein [Chloroflexota bacterium]